MSKSNYISESFRQRADGAAFMEAWVGAMLSRSGLTTVHHPFTLASETGNPLSFYAHTHDLDVSVDGKVYTPLEVKSSNLSFHDVFNYPHLGVLVCSDASFRKKWPGKENTQRDFLFASRVTGAIIWLPKGTPTLVKEQKDKTRNEVYACRAAHKGSLQGFASFVSYIKGEPYEAP